MYENFTIVYCLSRGIRDVYNQAMCRGFVWAIITEIEVRDTVEIVFIANRSPQI